MSFYQDRMISAFQEIKNAIQKHLRDLPQNDFKKRAEIEYCHQVRSIEHYGFNFFPKHYLDFKPLYKLAEFLEKKKTALPA